MSGEDFTDRNAADLLRLLNRYYEVYPESAGTAVTIVDVVNDLDNTIDYDAFGAMYAEGIRQDVASLLKAATP